MKKFYILLLSVFAFTFSFAQTNTAQKSGNWDDSKIWSNKHVPANGEIVEIPFNITVEVDDNEKFSTSDLDVRVFGKLVLNGGQLRIGSNSKITLFSTGSLFSEKGNGGDKVLIGNNETYNGKDGILYGPLMATKSTNGFITPTYTILPVKFASFNVTAKNSAVQVQWSTAEEMGASYFEVQRSLNGTDWSTIGQVKAAGNTNQLTDYSFIDKSKAASKVYYCIKQADADGKTVYTTVQTVTNAAANRVNIIAYQSKAAVQFAQPVKGKVEVVVVNRAGQVVAKQIVENGAGQVVLNNINILKGAYFVAVSNGAGISASQQIIL